MTRTSDRFADLSGAAAENAGNLAAAAADSVNDIAGRAASRVSALFSAADDRFSDRLIAKAKALDARNFVPSRRAIARTGSGAGLLLAGAAAIAAGAFALYYLKQRNQEEAEFDLLAQEGYFELRRYRARLVAETVVEGSRSEALDAGFGPLSDYLSAKPGARADGEDNDERIAMTVPVTATGIDQSRWRIGFALPARYDRETLPEPAAGVNIAEQAERHVAAIRFAGRGSDEALVDAKRQDLLAWVTERGYKPVGDTRYAFYNAPIVPGALRRNEVWIEIEAP